MIRRAVRRRKVIHMIDTTGTMHSARQGPLGIARKGAIHLVGVLCLLLGSPEASASNLKIDHLKLYAHFKIVSDTQYQCFYKIITKESRWSPTARNGSHYGLGQMRSKWYGRLDAYAQIDATLKYIAGRYGDSCSAWSAHVKKGWY